MVAPESGEATPQVLVSAGEGGRALRARAGWLIWLVLGLMALFILVWGWPKPASVPGLPYYLPVHVFLETFSIVAAFLAFGVIWVGDRACRAGNLVILGCALLVAGLIDFAHVLSFPGMPDLVTPASTEKAINFWLVARLVAALGLCAAAFGPRTPIRSGAVCTGLLAAGLLIVAVVSWIGFFHADLLPRTFIEGEGLTTVKVGTEYGVIGLLLLAAVVFAFRAWRESAYDAAGFAAAALLGVLSELSFTLYSSATDVFNLLGHVYKIACYALIYHAVVVGSPPRPAIDRWRAGGYPPYRITMVMAVAAAVIFAVDLNTPRGVSEHLAYTLVVLVGVWLTRPAHVYLAAGGCTVLVVLGFLLSPPGAGPWVSVLNRSLSTVAVWGVALVVVRLMRAREALHRTLDGLERQVEERTAQLRATNEDLESFSYSVSHDLRAPLRAIDGFSRILLDEYASKLDAEGRRLLDVVRDNTVRMSRLIDDILQFSRAGRLELAPVEIDVEALARNAWDELAPTVGTRTIHFVVNPLPHACADRSALAQVLVNLLANAVKFTRPRDPAMIEIGAESGERETVYHVRDNGVGFDMQYAHKLYGVFQRLYGQDEFEGTGIGLAIVKRIVTKHGGRVWAEGRVNGGATFFFSLPRREPCAGGRP